MVRSTLIVLAVAAGVAAGCGSEAPAAMPEALLGTYRLEISARGRADPDVMTITLGSDRAVLLDFTAGISQVRATVQGSTRLDLPPQRITVAHSTGAADGTATGGGSIVAGVVDVTIDLAAAVPDPDAGTLEPLAYHLTGDRI